MSAIPENRIPRQDHLIARLRSFSFVRISDAFFASPAYFLLIGILTVIANVFSAELIVYACFVLMGIYISLFGKDYLPVIPLVTLCYIAPSDANNPGSSEGSIFYAENGGILILVLAAAFVVSILFRLAADPELGQKAFLRAKRALLPGILLLGAAYLLAGAGSGHYFDHGYGNLLFAALQFLSIFLMYYFFTGAVKWSEAPEDYLAKSGLCIGFVLLAEIFNIYLTQPIIIDGEIQRSAIYTGWGNYNNIGAMLTMMIPFAFHLVCIKKHSWLYNLCGVAFLSGVLLSCSRGAILFAAVTYLISGLIVALKSRNRRAILYTNLIALGIVLLVLILFHEQLLQLFRCLLNRGLDPGRRVEGYQSGIQQFLKYPLFGGSFYPVDADLYEWSSVEAFTSFFPPRWHNTVIQLAASCGIVGLAAYGLHRLQTIRMILKKPTAANLCIAISLAALLGTSLIDCHFFNIGPTLFYAVALAFAEKNCPKE